MSNKLKKILEVKNANKIIIINLIIILILLIIIRLIKGPFYIATSHNNLAYDLLINNNKIDQYTVIEEYNKPIIPYFLYQHEKTTNQYNLHTNTYFSKSDNYVLDLKIYTCLNNDHEVSCLDKYDKIKGIKYRKNVYVLEIKYKENSEIVYKGKFINDITKYLEKNGDYIITITGKNDNIESRIEFILNVFN